MYLSKVDYVLLKFEKSRSKNKKYSALLKSKVNGKVRRMNFGDSRGYQQFKDTTGLGLYSHLDHNDLERQRRYINRHRGFIMPGKFSPGYFSLKYLWSAQI